MSKIEWTKATWNPVVGCTKVSPGCANCYAERMAKRLKGMGQAKYQDVVDENGWTGKICIRYSPPPKAKMVFVCSMSDLFYEKADFAEISKAIVEMYLRPDQTFQILTKRVERMAEYFALLREGKANLGNALKQIGRDWLATRLLLAKQMKMALDGSPPYRIAPNIWLGVTAENQEWADKRIPIFIQIPAKPRFLSCEPLLGPLNLTGSCERNPAACLWHPENLNDIDWVIVGCESGPRRRLCKKEWVEDIVAQCIAAGVPVFVKQVSINGRVVKDAQAIADYLGHPVAQIRQFPEAKP